MTDIADKLVEVMAEAIRAEIDRYLRCDTYKPDDNALGRVAAQAGLPILRDAIERAHRTAQYSPAPYTDGKRAIRARFDEIAKKLEG